jgi:starch synthase (maltosyl-transferring)
VLAYSKQTPPVVPTGSTDGTDVGDLVIVVINLDPHAARETMVHLDLPALGLDWHDSLAVHDEITGQDWHWGQHNYVRLDPYAEPAHLLTVRRTG